MADKQQETAGFTMHLKNARKASVKQWGSLIPPDFWKYRREARREMLLACRSLVDGVIDRLDPEGEIQPRQKPGVRKAKVQVE